MSEQMDGQVMALITKLDEIHDLSARVETLQRAIGKDISAVRSGLGRSGREFADPMRVSTTFFYNIERGTHGIPPERAKMLAEYLSKTALSEDADEPEPEEADSALRGHRLQGAVVRG